MKLVGSGFERKAGDALAGPAVFRGGIEGDNLEFCYCVLGEGQIAKVSCPFGGAADDRAIKVKLIAGTLASVHCGVQHARGTAVRHPSPRHTGSKDHEVSGISLFSYSNEWQ